ncbi:iron uptake transporter deferrochelatase/peroxidase subunit [Bartonella sp. HY038]|uniref:iron uptake transporter deferrochelatase/peroxidase subunit n=1 Tax=Bartonella sp. HY038 TaxID=2759660 RepID=UPI0015FBB2AD|nr:iron uptake transporter deferrochelatase/peroxidase subunit [Bartonella sp. HY038]
MTKSGSSPFNRRSFLKTASATALVTPTLVAGNEAFAQDNAKATHMAQSGAVTAAPTGNDNLSDVVAFYGEHQAGILTPRPATGLVAALNVVVSKPEQLEDLFRRLTDRIRFLTKGGSYPERDDKLPPYDSGILGPEITPNGLTVTVALGNSLFEKFDWLKVHKPAELEQMTGFHNDALVASRCHGDISIQICANDIDTVIHALRDINKNLSNLLVMKWMQEGSVPVIAPLPNGEVENARNFLGFRDGSANPDTNDSALMDRILWVNDSRKNEPEWARGGSYQAVRIIRNFVERWDRTPLQEQERIFGRKRDSGAPMDGKKESDVPDYTKDPDGKVTLLDAHIRLANPRTADSEKHQILRRPFNYSNGVTKSGQLDQGLLFICYQASLHDGFIHVQSQLDGEPLEEYLKPEGGGYFFTLPGVQNDEDWLGRSLMEAVKAS